MILFCQRQTELVMCRVNPNDSWVFPVSYHNFTVPMMGLEYEEGQRFVINMRSGHGKKGLQTVLHREGPMLIQKREDGTWCSSHCLADFPNEVFGCKDVYNGPVTIGTTAKDITHKYRHLMGESRRADALNRKRFKMATGTGGTKQNLMIMAHVAFAALGIGGTLYFHDTQILIHTIKALGLIAAVFALDYGLGKFSWNIRQGMLGKDKD